MKKLILILAIALCASQAFAALDVNVVQTGTNTIAVRYTGNGTTAATRARAFALDLQLQSGATFTAFVGGSYKANGESTAASRGYGIYPAKISIDSAAGTVASYGDPLADSADPGSGGTSAGFGTNHIVLEFGSLYYADTNAPASSGTLCSLTVNMGALSAAVGTMSDELTYRGGIVYEDGSQDLTAADKSFTIQNGTPPGPASAGAPTGIKIDVDAVLTWTAGSGSPTSHDVYFGTVLPGSPTATVTSPTWDPPGSMVNGKTYLVRVVEKNATGSSTAYDFSFTTRCFPKTFATAYASWVTMGMQDCWCSAYHCDGDADQADSGGATKYRVYTGDLNLVLANWKKKISDYPATLNACADVDHADSGGATKYRVYTGDLNIVLNNWKKKNSNLPGTCPRF
jgi:hypothetical protein